MQYWSFFLCVSSGRAGSDPGFSSVHADQRKEDQHSEPAAAEHAGGPTAPLCIISGKHWNTQVTKGVKWMGGHTAVSFSLIFLDISGKN